MNYDKFINTVCFISDESVTKHPYKEYGPIAFVLNIIPVNKTSNKVVVFLIDSSGEYKQLYVSNNWPERKLTIWNSTENVQKTFIESIFKNEK